MRTDDALMTMDAPDTTLALAREPEAVLQEAHKAARALKNVIDAKPNKVMFGGEQYIEFEDWLTVGRFYGLAPRNVSTSYLELGGSGIVGWEATAEAVHVATGRVVSRADAMCMNDEEKWRARPKYEWFYVTKGGDKLADPPKAEMVWEKGADGKSRPKKERVHVGEEAVPSFQLRSMAQTRAGAKALRNALAWVVVLAGYRPTPAEELPQVDRPAAAAPTQQAEDAEFTAAPARKPFVPRANEDDPKMGASQVERPVADAPAEEEPTSARGVDEAQERTILLGKIKGCADKLQYDAKTRAALWSEHVGGGDPRSAPIEKLADLYAHLKALAG